VKCGHLWTCFRLQLKCDGTRWRTGGEVKGKLANGMGSQYSSHYLGTWCMQHYYRWWAHLGCQQSTELTPPADLNGLVRLAERRNLVSARVPSHFNWPLPRNRCCSQILVCFSWEKEKLYIYIATNFVFVHRIVQGETRKLFDRK